MSAFDAVHIDGDSRACMRRGVARAAAFCGLLWVGSLSGEGGLLWAQSPRLAPPDLTSKAPAEGRAADRPRETTVIVEVLTDSQGVGLASQNWARVFEQLGVPLQIRRAIPGDKPDIVEKNFGLSLREVHAIGEIDRSGQLTFPGKSFRDTDTAQLKEWLRELQTYGAQGSPVGQPLWGLTRPQFEPLLKALAVPLEREPEGLPLNKALAGFSFTEAYPLQFAPAAEAHLARLQAPAVVRNRVQGFTQGTACAIVLNEFGLGLRPRRTPQGTVELVVVPLSESDEVWPVGWPRPTGSPSPSPQFFKALQVDLQNEPLLEVLEAVQELTSVPILYDQYHLAAAGIQIENLQVSHPVKRTTWSAALRAMLYKVRLRYDILTDEAGRPFLWIVPNSVPKRSADE